MGITYRIIPSNYRPYKLLVLSGLPENLNKPKLLLFILLEYQYNIIYDKVMNYMVENMNFFLLIIHTDFERAFNLEIKKNKYFGEKVIHSKCLFHFGQMIRKHLSATGYFKKN